MFVLEEITCHESLELYDILQVIDALLDKRFGQMRLFSMYTATPNESSITGVQMLMYTCKLCVKSHSCEFFDCLDHEFLNWENFNYFAKSTKHSYRFFVV